MLPGAFIVLILAGVYSSFGDLPLFTAFFLGIKATVIVIVLQALHRIANKALHSKQYWFIAFAAFIGIYFFASSSDCQVFQEMNSY